MADILSVPDLKNYKEISKNCYRGEMLYLTKNV